MLGLALGAALSGASPAISIQENSQESAQGDPSIETAIEGEELPAREQVDPYAPEQAIPLPPLPMPDPITAVLPELTPIRLILDEPLSTEINEVGDGLNVIVVEDVIANNTVVIPAGTVGFGRVSFVTRKGGWGKSGIIAFRLRSLELPSGPIKLEGHFREEGKNRDGATAATFFAVGILSGFIRGGGGFIEQGRELKGRTGEDMRYVVGLTSVQPGAPGAELENDPLPAVAFDNTSPTQPADQLDAMTLQSNALPATDVTPAEPEPTDQNTQDITTKEQI